MSFTTLKGFESVNQTDLFKTIQHNLVSFFDWGFLNKGAFSDVKLSRTNIFSIDRSTLKKETDPNFTDGQVYKTFTKNLVWESGLYSPYEPIQISGVYVNGSFKTPTTSGFEHYIDYKNGRVIFSSPLPTATVKMEYSYKTLDIKPSYEHPVISYLQTDKLYNTNVSNQSGVWGLLQQNKTQTTSIAIESVSRATYRPIELGNLNQWADVDIICHVFGSELDVNKYTNFISYQSDKTIFLYNIDDLVQSGMVPLDYRGAIHSNTRTYPDIINDFRFNRLYLGKATVSNPTNLGGTFHGTVRFQTESIGLLE